MSYSIEKISGNQTRIDFTVPAETFSDAMQKAYLKTRGRINVPGFRKGKAPRKLIESMYGESVFYDEAFDAIFPELYQEAVEKENLFPVDQPEVKLDQIGTGKELKFSTTVYVKPEVTLGEYKGLRGVRHLHPVPESEIELRIARDVEKVTTREEIKDRPAQNGDIANIDYEGSVAGVPFDGGKGTNHDLTLGSGSFIPGFEEQLIGMNPGEKKVITVTFPAEYHQENLAGKQAEFEVTVNSVLAEVKPEFNDDFAQDVSEYQTYQEYREAVVRELTEQRDSHAESHLEESLIRQAVDASDCDIPEAMVGREIDRMIQNMRLRMLYQGLKLEDYLKYTNTTEEDLRGQFRQDALDYVKTDLVLEAIGRKEGIAPSEEDIQAEIRKHAESMKADFARYRDSLNENQLENFRDIVINRKVVELIKSNADVSIHEGEHDEEVDAGEVIRQAKEALENAEEQAAENTDDQEQPEKKPARKTRKAADKQSDE